MESTQRLDDRKKEMRYRNLGFEKEDVNGRKKQERGGEGKKNWNINRKKKENEKEENTDIKKEKGKRGRKRQT